MEFATPSPSSPISRFDFFQLAAALAALAMPGERPRRLALAGVVAITLGLASLQVASGGGGGTPELPRTYAAITAGLLLLGLAGVLAAGWLAGREDPGPTFIRLPLIVTAAGLGAWVVGGLLRAGGAAWSLLALLGLGALGLVSWTLGSMVRLERIPAWLDRVLLDRAPSSTDDWSPTMRRLAVWQLAGATLALASPWLDLLFIGTAMVLVTGFLFERAGSPHRIPWASVVSGLLLLVTWYFFDRVGGPGRRIAALADGPFSPAFEILAANLLCLLCLPLLQLWPAHGARLGPVATLAGAALVGRVSAGVPLGMEHWQPITFLLAAATVWHGAARSSAARCLTAVGVIGGLSGSATAAGAGVGLVAAGTLYHLWERVGRPPWPGGEWARALWLIPLVLLSPVLAGGLGAQTFYTVIAAWGLAVAAWRAR